MSSDYDEASIEDMLLWTRNHLYILQGICHCCGASVGLPGKVGEMMKNLWYSGCWLAQVIENMGADEQRIKEIQFAHGQRSFGRDPVEVALAYANEYAQTNAVRDQPGPELADEINRDIFGENN